MQAGLGIPGVCPFAAYESASSWQETKHRHHAGKELDVIVVESGPPRVCLVQDGVQGPDRTGDRRPDCTSNGRACVA